MNITFQQNTDAAIALMRQASEWMTEQGIEVSKWWDLENLNKEFLFQYAKPEEFYIGMIDNKPVVAGVLQIHEANPEWKELDKDAPKPAIYLHWLCVDRNFAGQGLIKELVSFAKSLAKEQGIPLLRLDTDASKTKLRGLYERLGFQLVEEINEGYRTTAFYERGV